MRQASRAPAEMGTRTLPWDLDSPLIGSVLSVVVALTIVSCTGCGPNWNGSKLREVEGIQKTIPTFPGMVETHESRVSKGVGASIHKYYASGAEYSVVKQFYTDQLRRDDWEYVGERFVKNWGKDLGAREFRFQKNGYYVVIFYYGERSQGDSQYGVSVGWRQ